MRFRTTFTRVCATAVGTLLATATLAGPALATEPAGGAADTDTAKSAPVYKGRVVAEDGLLLRASPGRGGRIVRSERYGAIVHIDCKTTGDKVGNNNRWYLLTDGTWAWGSAYYIQNLGAAPRWC
ncbi:SH3 domain-containing protein [Streptomyces tsukubensis]|uniref:SH3 domain-containing protein n=1 Tax=Streptomyces tsukubensis TaxID=83656 RepID=A0A1V4ACA0_9ACTN|nr:SH3 domain-containing protein [Streptomyces tsukubensis]OON81182.1 hypothetical protein B1H18_07375 [Streptomyces tsukubensis]